MATKRNISQQQQQGLLDYMSSCWQTFPFDSLRNRLACIDRAVARQDDPEKAMRDRKAGKLSPVVVPIVQPQTDTYVSQLTKIFLSPGAMFQTVSAPENDDSSRAINALLRKHETIGAYPREFLLWFRDASKYDFHAVEISWKRSEVRNYGNNPLGSTGKPAEALVSTDADYYNSIKRISPYNIFFDTTVPAAKVHEDGEFVGYHEHVNFPMLQKLMNEVYGDNSMNYTEALGSSLNATDYVWDPTDTFVNPRMESVKDAVQSIDWNTFFDTDPASGKRAKRGYVLTTFYFRSTPRILGLRTEKADDTVRVYKLLIVNGTKVIYFGEQTNAHGYFPIIIGQPLEEGLGLETPSFVESIQPIQDLVTKLHTSRIADLARAISDRGIYDPLLVDGKLINSPNPTVKVPLKPYGQGRQMINQAYYQMPYRSDAAQSLIQEAAIVTRYGEEVGGLNPVQRGSFVKGNKTLGEFQTTMGNADDRMFVIGLMIEVQSMTPIKEILKSNILQYQGPQEVFDPDTRQKIAVDPTTLRKVQFMFQIADGLKPTNLFSNPDVLMGALQFISQSPQMQQEYDVVKLFAHIFNVKGADDLNSFRRQQPFIQQAPQQQPQPGQPGAQPAGVSLPASPQVPGAPQQQG